MELDKELIEQFKVRVFEESYARIYKCLSLITDEQLWFSPNLNVPPIGNQILHLAGNARQWVVSGLGGREDVRQRDMEFENQAGIRKSELVFVLENLKQNINETFEDLQTEDFYRRHSIQGFENSTTGVLIHVIEHFSYHTGQISMLTKILVNKPLGYYSEFELN
ncbi:MAG: DinB family protein [Crocinitomicaceae bacterium]